MMASVAVPPPVRAGAPKRFAVATLGCKVNAFESESIAQQFSARGLQRVDARERADVIVINTCTVTSEADRQSRQLVRRAIRGNPAARVIVTGCYAEMKPQECAAIDGVDRVVGNQRKLDIPTLLDAPRADADVDINSNPPLLTGFEGRARAFVQIQQGCDQGCTFCIIHRARGANRSVPMRRILRQAAQLARAGHRELVLCGVDIGGYGADLARGNDLPTLLRRLVGIGGDFRVRLSSIDPAHLSDALIETLAREAMLCPQLHLSLQSADTMILKRMKRRATREMVYARVAALRRAIPDAVLSADILVGFPTETEAQFEQTLRAVDELEIAYPHVFAYSPRDGTPAARIPKQVAAPERKRRAALVRARGRAVWRRVAARRIGARCRVLIEQCADGVARARAADYLPVRFAARDGDRAGAWAQVEITAVESDWLIARGLRSR